MRKDARKKIKEEDVRSKANQNIRKEMTTMKKVKGRKKKRKRE